jgi:hypothetical protein
MWEVMHSAKPSRITKTPAIWGWGLWYADKSGAWWGVGGWGKAPDSRAYFGPATILNLYRIAHSESTVDKWGNSPSVKL